MRQEEQFLYSKYQAIVEASESGDLKVTIAILAVVAGFMGLALQSKGAEPDAVLAVLYDETTVKFIFPMFLYGTWYSWWKRYRVLHTVSKLVALEEQMGVADHLKYWTDKRWRPWTYVMAVCPWPWLLTFFAAGAVFYGHGISCTVVPLCATVIALYAIPYRGVIGRVVKPYLKPEESPSDVAV